MVKPYVLNKEDFGGGQPEDMVIEAVKLLSSGKVLDIGSGKGRNAMYLAAHGFNVRAVDKNAENIEALKKHAAESGLSLQAEVLDAKDIFGADDRYDVITSTFVLHQVPDATVRALLPVMKERTNSGGLHALVTMTKNGDFWKDNPKTDNFYLNTNELKEMYSDWEILHYEEKERGARATNADGTHKSNILAEILARKP